MTTFKDLKIGDKIYRFDPETFEITSRIITDIVVDWGDMFFGFDGKMNLQDDEYYEKGEFIRLDERECDYPEIDSGWAIADLDCFLKELKEDLEEFKRDYKKKEARCEEAIRKVENYIVAAK
jgi:hypothetical protein